jgi:hypothetical protein
MPFGGSSLKGPSGEKKNLQVMTLSGRVAVLRMEKRLSLGDI